MSATLGVSTFVYFPYCFFNIINPLLGLIYGFVGFNVQHLAPSEQSEPATLLEAPVVERMR
jgi:NhaC family Na+:H+ antiporter